MERHDPLIDAIRRAGEVPPPRAREEARARAMAAIDEHPTRRRFTKAAVTLLAAALLALPAGVIAVRARTPAPSSVTESRRPEPPRATPSPDRPGDEKAAAVSTRGSEDENDGDRSGGERSGDDESDAEETEAEDTGSDHESDKDGGDEEEDDESSGSSEENDEPDGDSGSGDEEEEEEDN